MPVVKNLRRVEAPALIRQVLVAWLLAVLIEYGCLPGPARDLAELDGLAQMSLGRILLFTGLETAVLYGISCFVDGARAERWALAAIFFVLAALALQASFSVPFLAVCALAAAGLAVFGVLGWDPSPEPVGEPGKESRVYPVLTAVMALGFFALVSAWGAAKVYSFCTSTYDFGIFAQMFHNMSESGLPMTTVERDGLLSHFHVHMSPIYYLMLPLYWLVRDPAVLQVMQAAVLASAVIPLWKLGKLHGLSAQQRMLLCAALLFYPALAGGVSYDLHENCFLMPLILWLFYGIDRKSTAITVLSALLALMVKEDAAVYVAVIALWMIVRSALRLPKADIRDLAAGILLLGVSLSWFFVVTGYLAVIGDGVMTYRYENFMYDGSSSLMTVIQSVLLNPMKALYECVDPEKLEFIALTMLPLLGLPLLTRRYERYLLLIPYLLVNLMPDYSYQHDILYQYTFGSGACLLYLAAVNLADWKGKWQRVLVLLAAVLVSAGCFRERILPEALRYPELCRQHAGYYQSIREGLDTIPGDASVSAGTFLTTYLSQRETLYDVRYTSREHILETEYVALKISSAGDYRNFADEGQSNGFENLTAMLEENGYQVYEEVPGVLVIYHRAQ